MSTSASRPSVLFVCVHNAGRSQMAAAFLTHLAGDRIEVRSAGSAPADTVNPAVVEAMSEVGVDISAESPKILTVEAVQASDVVITMGCGDTCPVFPGKRYLDWKLDDPGQSVMVPRMQTTAAPLTQTVPSASAVISMLAARAQSRALGDPVGGGRGAGGGEPLTDAGVHAAARGVLGHADAGGEGTHLEAVPGPVGVGPDRADHRVRDEGEVGFEGEHLLGRGQLDHGPAGTVVDPLVGHDPVPRDAERGHDPVQMIVVERALTHPGRGGEGQRVLATAHGDQACGALLHDAIVGVPRCAAALQPGARGPEGGVPGERQLAPGVKIRSR
jgi:arsenate reductase